MVKIKFAKMDKKAVLPVKNEGDGYDVWGCWENKVISIPPHSIEKLPTKIASVIPNGYVMVLKERSSMGSKHLTVHAGVIDHTYRGEWLVCLSNDGDKTVVFYDDEVYSAEDNTIKELYDQFEWSKSIYIPKSNAICQALLLTVPEAEVTEITMSELASDVTKRGTNGFGSTDAKKE